MNVIKGPFSSSVLKRNFRLENPCGTGPSNAIMPLITKLTMELIKMRLGDKKVIHCDPCMDALVSTVKEVSDPPSRTLPNMKMGKSQRPVIPQALCWCASKRVDQVDRGSPSFNKLSLIHI